MAPEQVHGGEIGTTAYDTGRNHRELACMDRIPDGLVGP